MRYLVPLFLLLAGASCLAAAPAPVGVDALSQADVGKAVAALKGTFVRRDALSDAEIERATLQGLLDRLAPEADLVSGTGPALPASPFYSENYGGRGYLRLGELTAENVQKAVQALKDWSGKGIVAVVLDLRGTPASSDFNDAGGIEGLFCGKGTQMFSLYAGAQGTSPGMRQNFVAGADPLFKGIVVVLVDGATAEAPEAIAASLQECAAALVVGERTAGRAFEYQDVPLGGAVLRVAVAQVILPDGKKLGESGLKPDIEAPLGAVSLPDLMQSVTEKGVASVIEEHDRPHLNEAALVSGSNPYVDELEAEESGKAAAQPLIDRQLQRALDLVTSISVYQAKGQATPGSGE